MPGEPGARGSIAQGPRIKPNKTGKTNRQTKTQTNKQTKHLIDWSLASSERLHPAPDRRCRDPQPNIRWSSGNLVEEGEEGL